MANITDLGQTSLVILGKHGGSEKSTKLEFSLQRSKLLTEKIKKFKPDLTISFCSPEASRVSFGLGIKHIAFSDSPQATAVMRLTVPLVNKLLIPWIFPKSDFTKFGIEPKNIIQYKTIDAAMIVKRKMVKKQISVLKNGKTILIRPDEDEAAYSSKQSKIIDIIQRIIKDFPDSKKIVLTRYKKQTRALKKKFSDDIHIISKVVDGKVLLLNSDIFVGSGGTMTAESALLGIPTISYNATPNRVEDFLITKKNAVRCMTPSKISKNIEKIFCESRKSQHVRKKKLEKILSSLEDPHPILLKTMKSIIK